MTNRLTDDGLVDAFLAALPGEPQEVSADRVGKDRSQISRWRTARKAGESVSLQAETRVRMEEALELLTLDTPAARARREAYQRAADQAQGLADRLRAMGATAPGSGASLEDQGRRVLAGGTPDGRKARIPRRRKAPGR